MKEFRVQELAEQAGITVELLRSYQSKGLLPQPCHEGRVAWYGARHLERLRLIKDLKDRGYSLRTIEQAIRRGAEQPEEAIAVTELPEERLTLAELAERTRVPPAMLRSLEASGVLRPRRSGVKCWYTEADVKAVRQLLTLLGGGLPMEEFMRVASVQLETAQAVADGAVDLFMKFGRAPLVEAGLPREEAERMVAALRLMMDAAASLMTYNFQRMVLTAAEEAIEKEGSQSERAALKKELERRRVELAIPA